MSKSVLLMSCCLCALVFLACAKPDATTNREATNATAKASPSAPAASTPTTTVSANETIGVAECDDFITKYDACVSSKVPEAARPQLKSSIALWRSSWKKLADNPQTKASLVSLCKQTMEQQKTAMTAYGCTF